MVDEMKPIGGVNFSSDLVESSRTIKDKYGKEMFEVRLSTGVVFQFYEQQTPVTVKGHSHRDILFRKDNHLVVNGLKNGTIFGSDAGDAISLQFCKNLTVNVKDKDLDNDLSYFNKRDAVILDKDSKDITVISDSNDEIIHPNQDGELETEKGGLDFKW